MEGGKEGQSAHIAEKLLVNGFSDSVNPKNTTGARLLLPSVKGQVLVLCHFVAQASFEPTVLPPLPAMSPNAFHEYF